MMKIRFPVFPVNRQAPDLQQWSICQGITPGCALARDFRRCHGTPARGRRL